MQPPHLLPFMIRVRSASSAALVLAGVLACVPPRPAPVPGTPSAPDVTTPRRSADRWSLEREAGVARYEIRSSATIALAGDTLPADSLVTTMIVSLALADSADVLAVTGTIDSIGIERGSRVIAGDTMPVLPVGLRAVLDRQGGVLALSPPSLPDDSSSVVAVADSTVVDSAGASACGTTLDPLVAMTRDLFVRLPARLTTGMAWQDTTQTTSCRGRIPITTTTISSYTVRGEGPGERIAIDRQVDVTVAGNGVQHGRSAAVQGSGSGTGVLLIDPATAALVEGRSESTITITFEAGMLRQTFTQQGRQDIRLR